MNFIYFSPNFPDYGWKFCHHLKQNGVNVLGIGDAPYDELLPELKEALTNTTALTIWAIMIRFIAPAPFWRSSTEESTPFAQTTNSG